MAFNPLSSFRKYQKIWMSGVLLLCMVTFVLCTGMGGDLSDRILSYLRPKGEDYVRIGGKRYNYTDIEEVKDYRNIANDFMRTLSDVGLRQLDKEIKAATPQQKKEDKYKERLGVVVVCRDDLFTKLTRDQRYFPGGTKLNDLIDFIVWLQLADKYDIQINDEDLRKIVNREVHGFLWDFNEYVSREVQYKVRN